MPPPGDPPGGFRYSPLRFQVDPLDPPPRRDRRWTMIVVGFSLVVLGILLLVVSAIVSTAVASGGASCGSATCPTVDPGPWFALLGFAMLGPGLVLGAVGAWRALRTS